MVRKQPTDAETLKALDLLIGGIIENAESCRDTGYSDWSPDYAFLLDDIVMTLEEKGTHKNIVRLLKEIDDSTIILGY